MKTSVHLLVSSILAVSLYHFFGWKVLLIIIGGVFIDIDHYFYYMTKFKKFSPHGCYNYFIEGLEGDNYKRNIGIMLVFHTIEFLLLMVALSFFSEYALMFSAGLLPHYFMDLLYLYNGPKQLIANPSVINWVCGFIQKIG